MDSALHTPYGQHLGQDRRWAALLAQHPPLSPGREDQLFYRLCRSILGQQLSVRVARVIADRFLEFFGGQPPQAEDLIKAEFQALRSLGLSEAKVRYMKAWAQYALDTGWNDQLLHSMDDEQVRQYLLPVPGIGPWTVDMVLLFSLGREDVWPVGDLGVRLSAFEEWGLQDPGGAAGRRVLLQLAETWRPYRSYAALHLWHERDRKAEGKKAGKIREAAPAAKLKK